jgi:dienelactone hydrolase
MPVVRLCSRLFVLLFLISSGGVLTCVAKSSPAPQTVNLTAPDGVILKATYFAAGKPGPGILLLHQCDEQRKVWDGLAERLVASGINVLTVDYRGYGESGGTPHDKLTPQEQNKIVTEVWPKDIELAYSYLVWHEGVEHDKIAAGGASCGVNNAIRLARRYPDVKALLLLSGPTDRDGRLFLQSSNRLPIFTGAADDDKYGNLVDTMQWLFSVSPSPASRYVHYAEGGHGANMFTAHKELPGVIAEWFNAVLAKNFAQAPKTNGAPIELEKLQILDKIDQAGGASEVAKALAQAREHDPKAELFNESFVNLIGYEHLQIGDTKGAVEIMKLNATAYPDSPNADDSLSDVYLADGQKDLALQNAKKALELLPGDTTDAEQRRKAIRDSAEQKVKQLSMPTP